MGADGDVLGVNAGGYDSDVGTTLSGYNYAIRIDALESLMAEKGIK